VRSCRKIISSEIKNFIKNGRKVKVNKEENIFIVCINHQGLSKCGLFVHKTVINRENGTKEDFVHHKNSTRFMRELCLLKKNECRADFLQAFETKIKDFLIINVKNKSKKASLAIVSVSSATDRSGHTSEASMRTLGERKRKFLSLREVHNVNKIKILISNDIETCNSLQ